MATKLSLCAALIISASAFIMNHPVIAQPQGGMGAGPDLSSVAEQLGVSEDELRDALGDPPPNLTEAAEKLGITEEELIEALPPRREGGPPQG